MRTVRNEAPAGVATEVRDAGGRVIEKT